MMITVCTTCGNYMVRPGQEVEAARTLVKKLRLLLKDPKTQSDATAKNNAMQQLRLKVELLALASQDEIDEASVKRLQLCLAS
jgi:hypothetical protein